MPLILLLAATIAGVPPPHGPVVNGTTRPERAAAPDMRFASAAEAKAHCEAATVKRMADGSFTCSSKGRPITRTRTRHSGVPE